MTSLADVLKGFVGRVVKVWTRYMFHFSLFTTVVFAIGIPTFYVSLPTSYTPM
jgi:hypothetical protein